MFFHKQPPKTYNPSTQKPVIRASICNGEQVAGFVNLEDGTFSEEMLIRSPEDLEAFKKQYGIMGEIEKIY